MTSGASDSPATPQTARSGAYIGSFALAGRTIERLSSFGQVIIIASIYGSTTSADLFFLASIVPLTIGTVGGEALASSTLPTILRRLGHSEREAAAGLWLSVLALGVAVAVYVLVATVVVHRLKPAGSSSTLPWLVFATIGVTLGLSAYLGSVLLAYERYAWPPLRGALASFLGLVLLLLVAPFTQSITAIALAVAVGYAASLGTLAYEALRIVGGRELLAPTWTAVRRMLSVRRPAAAALLTGLFGGQAFVLAERALAASAGVGATATISYARGIAFAPNVVGQAIAAAHYPGMVRSFEAGRIDAVRERFVRGLRLTTFVTTIVICFYILFGQWLVGALLQHGAFSPRSVHAVGSALLGFALALLGNMLLIFGFRVFYSVDYFRASVWSQLVVTVAYAIAAPLLRHFVGLTGLAVAFSIAEVAGGLVAVELARRRLLVSRLIIVRAAARAALLGVLVSVPVAIVRLAALPTVHTERGRDLAVVCAGLLAIALAAVAVSRTRWPESAAVRRTVTRRRR